MSLSTECAAAFLSLRYPSLLHNITLLHFNGDVHLHIVVKDHRIPKIPNISDLPFSFSNSKKGA